MKKDSEKKELGRPLSTVPTMAKVSIPSDLVLIKNRVAYVSWELFRDRYADLLAVQNQMDKKKALGVVSLQRHREAFNIVNFYGVDFIPIKTPSSGKVKAYVVIVLVNQDPFLSSETKQGKI